MSTPRTARIAISGGGLVCARVLQLHGFDVSVYERETSADARWQGGTLDLHVPTGQAALRVAGLDERFTELARPEGQEVREYEHLTGALLLHEKPEAGTVEAPEIDRGRLRALLLESLAPGTVLWGRQTDTVTPAADGRASIRFGDGTIETFDLVIGADGAWSRTRQALSGIEPSYLGTTFVGNVLEDADNRHPALAELVAARTSATEHSGPGRSAPRISVISASTLGCSSRPAGTVSPWGRARRRPAASTRSVCSRWTA